ncbi:hypothetical protein [Paenibacillus plantiphilus]|uniref:hypothetical protein n=1 Tax=Paenibacillus plantiphilus TaxID=2905650 RepID=UPI001F329C06|nr:hypothetical protein [Paenibacillus plantiphilus]
MVQPIAQLSRALYVITDVEFILPIIARYQGRVMNGLSLKGKMNKHAWSRGDVVDGGMYFCYYKKLLFSEAMYELEQITASFTEIVDDE